LFTDYVQVLGLGNYPTDVKIVGERGIYCPATDPGGSGSLDTFWRSVENLTTGGPNGMLWAVSQAAPLRNVVVQGDLKLSDGDAFSSGGFAAQEKAEYHTVVPGTQQQFCFRDCEFGAVSTTAWSQVFIGGGKVHNLRIADQDIPLDSNRLTVIKRDNLFAVERQTVQHPVLGVVQLPAHSQVLKTPLIAEKPFVSIDDDGLCFFLNVPGSERPKRDFSGVFVYSGDTGYDTSAELQLALDSGLDIVLCPGVYSLSDTLHIRVHDQVFLCLGMATLVAPTSGRAAIYVPPTLRGVRLAGLFIEASAPANATGIALPLPGSCLLQWGEHGEPGAGCESVPAGFIYDLFCRVGGSNPDKNVSVDTIAVIHSNWVVGDNMWLWRADHAVLEVGETPPRFEKYHLVTQDEYKCNTALRVTGDNVFM
jgi:hypothetical protein